MNFVNDTRAAAGWTLGFERDGRELLIVAAKATFTIPKRGADLQLAKSQLPLTQADEFTGVPGLSAPLYETDYSHRKSSCDVLINGSAYAPHGKPVDKAIVGFKIGPVSKSIAVVGNRIWQPEVLGSWVSRPEPFTVMPISYNNAFGGVDDKNPENPVTFRANPVGRGFYRRPQDAVGRAVPNTEEIHKSIRSPTEMYRPMAFGPLGRNWEPRADLCGTYDKDWLDRRAPFFPEDFDYRYFQAAPTDQQMPFPTGGEQVTLNNLTPEGVTSFNLPTISVPVLIVPHRGKATELTSVVDTLVIEPDDGWFSITWRASWQLRRDCFELAEVIVGKTLGAHRRRRAKLTKTYYRNLNDLVKAKAALKAQSKGI